MYIFGIDLPIMEMLFIFVVVLFFALFVILYQIKQLKSLIMTEQSDIYRFEEDMKNLPSEKAKVHTKTLQEYVKKAVDKGYSKSEVAGVLTRKGWPHSMVHDAMKDT